VYKDFKLIETYPKGHHRSGVGKTQSKQYGYSESLKSAGVLLQG
jgi:hypothetical protein